MTLTRNEKAFCVLEYARARSNKSVQRAFLRKFNKNASTGKQIWTWHKKSKTKVVCAGLRDLDDHQYWKISSVRLGKHLCEAPESL